MWSEEQELKRCTDRIIELETALSFYANKENYVTSSTGFAAQYDPAPAPIRVDMGSRAREALHSDGSQRGVMSFA